MRCTLYTCSIVFFVQDKNGVLGALISPLVQKRNERPDVGSVSITRTRKGAPSRKGRMVNGQVTQDKQQMSTPPGGTCGRGRCSHPEEQDGMRCTDCSAGPPKRNKYPIARLKMLS